MLRRYMLDKYHSGTPFRVFDCCQGGGVLWQCLREEYDVAAYWGVDVKPQRGRLKIDSRRLMASIADRNVVDIDTYGNPWQHWLRLLPHIRQSTTVFLTLGQRRGMTNQTKEVIEAIGLGQFYKKAPISLLSRMGQIAVSRLLTKGCDYGLIAIEAIEAVAGPTARYFAVRLCPDSGTAGSQPGRPKHTQAEKEPENV